MQLYRGRNVQFKRLDGGAVRIDYVTAHGAPIGGETLESDDWQAVVVMMSCGGPDEATESVVRVVHDGPDKVLAAVGDAVDVEEVKEVQADEVAARHADAEGEVGSEA